MPDWVGSKRHPPTVAVKRKKDGNRMVIRAENYDAALHDLDGDGTVKDYDPTETAADVQRKATEATEKAAKKAEVKAAVAEVEAEKAAQKRGPGRPKKESK